MFKKDKQKVNNSNSTTLISLGTKIVGDVNFSGVLNIEGEVIGNINAVDDTSSLMISQDGKISGDIKVPNVLINGAIEGNVYSNVFLELSSCAKINGDLFYKELKTEKGSIINGRVIFDKLDQKSNNADTVKKMKAVKVESKKSI
jgi:cytoskeletal protein CcmA (bactofilin family)